MEQLITGIHHVTALSGNAQKNLEFYAGILGLRLVKKTVNYDAPEVYHLYYGDKFGKPGSILTFFPYEGLVIGRHGKGMVNTTSFSVPIESIGFWTDRLKRFKIPFKDPEERFENEIVIYLEDADCLGIELVFNNKDKRNGYTGVIYKAQAIRGLYGVEIWEEGYERTAGLLTEQLDHKLITEKGNRFRFAVKDSPGNYVDLVCAPDSLKGLTGSGTVHHLAFATADKNSQELIRNKILGRSLNPTPVLDRKYFSSIYFREPGGVLFEVATVIPGFEIDEDLADLGQSLQLPGWLVKDKQKGESELEPLSIDLKSYL
jgi:glyoxalase family protein